MPCRADGFVLPVHVVPGEGADSYLCPICHKEQGCYQLRADINGVPRSVDLRGNPCEECLRTLDDPLEGFW